MGMKKMAQVIRELQQDQVIFKCSADGQILYIEYRNGAEVRADSCNHFEWIPVGNGCYPIPMDEYICAGTDEIARLAVKKIDTGTTIWFLVPSKS